MDKSDESDFVLGEATSGRLIITPTEPILNVFVICSHPKMFGFTTQRLPADSHCLELHMHATVAGPVNVKFLIRYEVKTAQTAAARFRFKRVEYNLNIL